MMTPYSLKYVGLYQCIHWDELCDVLTVVEAMGIGVQSYFFLIGVLFINSSMRSGGLRTCPLGAIKKGLLRLILLRKHNMRLTKVLAKMNIYLSHI